MSESRGNSGSPYYDPQPLRTIDDEDLPDARINILGFRLAFDSAEQRDRGGCWNYDISDSPRAFGGNASPAAKVKTLGFRLAREDT